jgi:hypothetical protein
MVWTDQDEREDDEHGELEQREEDESLERDERRAFFQGLS